MSLAAVGIAWTVAFYGMFALVYGESLFDTDWGVDDGDSGGFLGGIVSFFTDLGDFIGDLGQFLTFGALSGKVPPALAGFIIASLGLVWLIVLVGMARGTPAS